jgi:hypothetical protein
MEFFPFGFSVPAWAAKTTPLLTVQTRHDFANAAYEDQGAVVEALQAASASGAGWEGSAPRTGPELCMASGWMEKGALMMLAVEHRDGAALVEMCEAWGDHRTTAQSVLGQVMAKTRRIGMPKSF